MVNGSGKGILRISPDFENFFKLKLRFVQTPLQHVIHIADGQNHLCYPALDTSSQHVISNHGTAASGRPYGRLFEQLRIGLQVQRKSWTWMAEGALRFASAASLWKA